MMIGNITKELEYTRCNFCEADETELLLESPDRYLGTPGLFRLVRCRQCGLKYLNPRPTPEKIGEHYPADYREYATARPQPYKFLGKARLWFAAASQAAYLKLYRGYQPSKVRQLPRPVEWLLAQPRRTDVLKVDWVEGGRLLDVGCSNGRYLEQMRDLGWQVAGVELNTEAARYAREVRGLEVCTGTLREAHYPDQYFDVITCSHVLEHFHDPLSELQEMRRILKPSGQLVIALPNWDSLGRRLFGSYWMALEIPRHLYHFDRHTLREMLAQAGFRVVRESFTWRAAVWLDSLLFLFGTTANDLAGTPYRLYGFLVRNLDRLQLPELVFNILKLSDVVEVTAK